MGLESATYITALDASNPLGTDLKSQGDDHLRLIKSVLKATFPNASRQLRFTNALAAQTANYAVDAAIADHLVIPCNANGGGFTITLPATPAHDGTTVFIVKTDTSVNEVTIDGNGNNINSLSSCKLTSQWQTLQIVWCATISTWVGIGGYGRGGMVGEMKAYSGTTAPCGWLRCNGQTIGNAASSATGRALADTEALFRHLWANYADAVCPVSGGRGASSAADYAANKTIGLPDLRGRTLAGLDDMGASAAGRLGSVIASPTTNGASGGSETVTLAENEIPEHDHGAGTLAADSDGAHAHTVPIRRSGAGNGGGPDYRVDDGNTSTSTAGAHTHTISGSTADAGGGDAHSNMQPTFLVTWLIKF